MTSEAIAKLPHARNAPAQRAAGAPPDDVPAPQENDTRMLADPPRDAGTAPALPATATEGAAQPDVLFAQFYERLKSLASRQLARGARGTLDTTALVHELYLRVNRQRELAFEQPAQFFSYAARAMRHLLADHARDRLRLKAGGDWIKVTLTGDGGLLAVVESAEQVLALEEALQRLESEDPRAARVVELHWFAGIAPEEIAAMLGLSRRTVDRDWRYARAFLHATLE